MNRALRLLREWWWWLGREGSWRPGEPRFRYGPIAAWQCALATVTLEEAAEIAGAWGDPWEESQ